ncbi:3124_t:CDS:2, partial [Funneliformis geosporum]
MRDYYNNATVTLLAIHAEVGEENIRKLTKSFESGESGLIYPNKIIDNALPILEKIMVKNRGRALPVDGIYSIIGLLPYGDKIKVDYGKDPESVLQEVMSGSSSVKGGIKITYKPREGGINEGDFFEPSKGIKVKASEYIITSVEKSD